MTDADGRQSIPEDDAASSVAAPLRRSRDSLEHSSREFRGLQSRVDNAERYKCRNPPLGLDHVAEAGSLSRAAAEMPSSIVLADNGEIPEAGRE